MREEITRCDKCNIRVKSEYAELGAWVLNIKRHGKDGGSLLYSFPTTEVATRVHLCDGCKELVMDALEQVGVNLHETKD